MDIRLDGRVALITGGSMGMGKAMAQKFASSGAEVAIVARRQEPLTEADREITAAGGRCRGYSGDVSKADEVERLFEAVVRDYGRVDILVNNAGRSQAAKFEELTDEIWQGDFDLKVFTAVRFSRRAFSGMKNRRWGRIINVLNIGAKHCDARGRYGVDQGAGGRGRALQYPRQLADDRPHRERPMDSPMAP